MEKFLGKFSTSLSAAFAATTRLYVSLSRSTSSRRERSIFRCASFSLSSRFMESSSCLERARAFASSGAFRLERSFPSPNQTSAFPSPFTAVVVVGLTRTSHETARFSYATSALPFR